MNKKILKHALAASLTLSVAAEVGAQIKPLDIKVFSAEESGFFVSSVLVSGKTDAVLLDTQFTRANALRVAAMVLESGKKLTTVYISHGDPDYYFGAEFIHQQFPDAKIVASASTVSQIKANLQKKLDVWGPQLRANGPGTPFIPEAIAADSIDLEGQKLELVGYDDPMAYQHYVWIPSRKAIVGGVSSFSSLHVWTADTAQKSVRAGWVQSLDELIARNPEIVVPGHMKPGSKLDASALRYTRDYLGKFEQKFDKSSNSAELIAAMKKAYPEAGLGVALDIGAKVTKGEMKW
ncbi:MAG: MBL fold metallo-hydrolase [Betaproteobacteria bacterium]|nr:MBL fold metallo-hydrolase [Betaproteobacteria bacterium]